MVDVSLCKRLGMAVERKLLRTRCPAYNDVLASCPSSRRPSQGLRQLNSDVLLSPIGITA
jgi:hypothetical protein